MLNNVVSLIKNTKFQIGIGAFIVLVSVGWLFTNSDDQTTETVTSESASTASPQVELTEHNQTPIDKGQETTEQENVDVKEDNTANSID